MQKLISIFIISLLALVVSSEDDHHDSQATDSCLVNNHYGSHGEEEHEEEDDISCPLESIQENGIQQLYAQNPSGEKINEVIILSLYLLSNADWVKNIGKTKNFWS